MSVKNKPPILVPREFQDELAKLSKSALDCREQDDSAPHSRNSQLPTKTNVLMHAA
jgi:hypothetical protein